MKKSERPKVEDVAAYIKEKGYNIDPEAFVDHYEMIGWVYGKDRKPIVDWKAAVRTWVRNQKQYNGRGNDIQPKTAKFSDTRY